MRVCACVVEFVCVGARALVCVCLCVCVHDSMLQTAQFGTLTGPAPTSRRGPTPTCTWCPWRSSETPSAWAATSWSCARSSSTTSSLQVPRLCLSGWSCLSVCLSVCLAGSVCIRLSVVSVSVSGPLRGPQVQQAACRYHASVCLAGPVCLWLAGWPCLSLSVSVCLFCLFPSLVLCEVLKYNKQPAGTSHLSVCLALSVSVCLSVCLALSVSVCLSGPVCLCLSVCLALSVWLALSVCQCPSVCFVCLVLCEVLKYDKQPAGSTHVCLSVGPVSLCLCPSVCFLVCFVCLRLWSCARSSSTTSSLQVPRLCLSLWLTLSVSVCVLVCLSVLSVSALSVAACLSLLTWLWPYVAQSVF